MKCIIPAALALAVTAMPAWALTKDEQDFVEDDVIMLQLVFMCGYTYEDGLDSRADQYGGSKGPLVRAITEAFAKHTGGTYDKSAIIPEVSATVLHVLTQTNRAISRNQVAFCRSMGELFRSKGIVK